MHTIRDGKKEIRSFIQQTKQALSQEAILSMSERIASTLYQQDYFRDAKEIYLYVSFNQEVLTVPIIERAIKEGKRVAIPRVERDEILFYEVQSLDGLKVSPKGIPEPLPTRSVIFENALMILPGLAFDVNGARIGYGGGYYDRFLEKHHQKIEKKISLAYDFQVFEQLNIEEFDERVDGIITDKRIITRNYL